MKKTTAVIFTLLLTVQFASGCEFVVPTVGFVITGMHTNDIPGYYKLDLVGGKFVSSDIYLDLFNKAIVGLEGIKGDKMTVPLSAYSSVNNFSVIMEGERNYTVSIPYTTAPSLNITYSSLNYTIPPNQTSEQLKQLFTVFFSQKYHNFYIIYGWVDKEYIIFNINSQSIKNQGLSPALESSRPTIYDAQNMIVTSGVVSGCGTTIQHLLYNDTSIFKPLLPYGTWDMRISLLLTMNGVYSSDTVVDHYLVQYYNYTSQIYEKYTLPLNVFDKYITGPEGFDIFPYVVGVVGLLVIASLLIYRNRDEYD